MKRVTFNSSSPIHVDGSEEKERKKEVRGR